MQQIFIHLMWHFRALISLCDIRRLQTDVFAKRIECAGTRPINEKLAAKLPETPSRIKLCGMASGPLINIGLVYIANAHPKGGAYRIIRQMHLHFEALLANPEPPKCALDLCYTQ